MQCSRLSNGGWPLVHAHSHSLDGIQLSPDALLAVPELAGVGSSDLPESGAAGAATSATRSPIDILYKVLCLVLASALALVSANVSLGFSAEQAAAQRCLGIMVFVSVCWALVPMPSHVTALAVPLLAVICDVMRVPATDATSLVPSSSCAQLPFNDHNTTNPGDRMPPDAAAAVLSASFFDPIILLFVSGFTMAAALDKHHISQRLALMLLNRAGTRPSRVLLALILLGVLMSMWLSNVSAAVLLSAVVRPVLRELPEESQWPKMVLLGIAYSCNLGGMTSPIASPQNVIAISSLRRHAGVSMSFVQWCAFSLPFVLIVAVLVWLLMRCCYKTRLPDGLQGFRGAQLPPLGLLHAFVIIVVLATVVLFCTFGTVESPFGNLGIVGLFPLLLFYGTEVLSKSDFNSMPWDVLILMGGGLALGNAVESSGLLDVIAHTLEHMLVGHGLWLTAFVFNLFAAVLANFLSSTVFAIIALPIVARIGVGLGHARLLTVGVCIMTSGAMGLPVSSFPNANSATVKRNDKTPETYLNNSDYVRTGFPMAAIVLTLLSTFGYTFFMLLGW